MKTAIVIAALLLATAANAMDWNTFYLQQQMQQMQQDNFRAQEDWEIGQRMQQLQQQYQQPRCRNGLGTLYCQ